ncbi:hypothetical protein F5050DRAFT_1573241, partial [Lentinula boryana]
LDIDELTSNTALLYYDWLLTFPEEVEYIWKARLSRSTVYYVFCRYALVANVLYLLEISNILGSRVRYYLHLNATLQVAHYPSFSVTCDDWRIFVSVLSVCGRAAIIATLIARTNAVCSQNRWILAYLVALGIACVVTDAVRGPELTQLFWLGLINA